MHSKQLFMSLSINRQFCRQVQALQYLSKVRTTVSIVDLSKVIGCSVPTLRADIRAFNTSLPCHVQLESLGKDGYFLSYPEGVSIPAVIMDLARETDVYRIIDGIFNNKKTTFERLASDLYLSTYSLKRILRQINVGLEDFNISISFSPLDFVGSEKDIRYFLFSFYQEFNDFFAVDKDFELNALAYRELIEGSIDLIKPNIHISHFRATMWIMIIRNRIMYKHFVELDQTFRDRILKMYHYADFSNAFRNAFSNVFQITKLSDDEVMWAFVLILDCVSYSEPTCSLSEQCNREFILHRYVDLDLLERINLFLSSEFSPSLVEGDLLNKMRSYLINLDTLTLLSPQFQRTTEVVKVFAKEAIGEYYKIWMQHLYSKEGQNLFPLYFMEDIAVGLALMHFSLQSHLKHHNLKVLFAFQGESGYDDFLIQQTKFMIPQNIDSCYIIDEPITKVTLDHLNPNLIVSNYSLPNQEELSTRVVKLSHIPNLAEWTSLRNIIMDMTTFTS